MTKSTFLLLVLLLLLLVLTGGTIASTSVDVVSHYALVNELMTYGGVRPQDTYLAFMQAYPPLAHWGAAIIGWVGGSGLVGMWLLAVASVYFTYYTIARILLVDGSIACVAIYAAVFWFLQGSRALMGWEIVENFFFPQAVAFTAYFVVLLWLCLRQRSTEQIAIVVVLLTPILFFTQALAAFHLVAAAACLLFVEAAVTYVSSRKIAGRHIMAIFAICAVAFLCLRLPSFRQILANASNDGWLVFTFPYVSWVVPAVVAGLACAGNLILALRSWPNGLIDRVVGAAGVAAAGLMTLQYLALVVFDQGSPYAVRKHLFVLLALGMINLARLAARPVPKKSQAIWAPYAAALLAFSGSYTILHRQQGTGLPDIVAVQRFAGEYAAMSPDYKPGNTSSAIASMNPTIDMLLTVATLKVSLNAGYEHRGKPVPGTSFVIVDRSAASDKCSIWANSRYSVTRVACAPAP